MPSAALICDVDAQGSTADWHNFRQERKLKGPGYAPLRAATLKNQIAELDAAGAAYLFIDMKAGVGPSDDAILAEADRVLIPLNPKPADMLALSDTSASANPMLPICRCGCPKSPGGNTVHSRSFVSLIRDAAASPQLQCFQICRSRSAK